MGGIWNPMTFVGGVVEYIKEEVSALYECITHNKAVRTYEELKRKSYHKTPDETIKQAISTLYSIKDNFPERRLYQLDSLVQDLTKRLISRQKTGSSIKNSSTNTLSNESLDSLL